jgi:hypothetical protein
MDVRELRSSPRMLVLFGRAAVGLVPLAGRLPFVGGGGGDVPNFKLALDGVEVSRERLATYDRVCGFQLGDTLPPTHVHMLAFPLALALLTDGRFPLPAIGLVHVFNRIVQHRPIGVGETLSLTVGATPLEPHPRGTQFSLRSEARVDDELVWEEVSTNLRRGRGADTKAAGPPAVPDASELPAPPPGSCAAISAVATEPCPAT